MSIRNYLENSSNLSSGQEESEMLITVADKSHQHPTRQHKLYTVSDEYLLKVIKVQRQSKEQVIDMKKQMQKFQTKLAECEDKIRKLTQAHNSSERRHNIYSQSDRRHSHRQHKQGRTNKFHLGPEIVSDNSSNNYSYKNIGNSAVLTLHHRNSKNRKQKNYKSGQKDTGKYLVIDDYGSGAILTGNKNIKTNNKLIFGGIETGSRSKAHREKDNKVGRIQLANPKQFLLDSDDLLIVKKNEIQKYLKTSPREKEFVGNGKSMDMRKLKEDYDYIARLERREQDYGAKKSKRKQMTKISQLIDQLEKTQSKNDSRRTEQVRSPQIRINRNQNL